MKRVSLPHQGNDAPSHCVPKRVHQFLQLSALSLAAIMCICYAHETLLPQNQCRRRLGRAGKRRKSTMNMLIKDIMNGKGEDLNDERANTGTTTNKEIKKHYKKYSSTKRYPKFDDYYKEGEKWAKKLVSLGWILPMYALRSSYMRNGEAHDFFEDEFDPDVFNRAVYAVINLTLSQHVENIKDRIRKNKDSKKYDNALHIFVQKKIRRLKDKTLFDYLEQENPLGKMPLFVDVLKPLLDQSLEESGLKLKKCIVCRGKGWEIKVHRRRKVSGVSDVKIVQCTECIHGWAV
jgi:hypothetical protein